MTKVLGNSNYNAPAAKVKIVAPTMTADEVKNFYEANEPRHNDDGSTFQRQPQYYDTAGNFHQGGGYLFRRSEVSDPENPGQKKTNYEWIDTTMGSMSHDVKAGRMEKPEFKTPEMISKEIEGLRGLEQPTDTKSVQNETSATSVQTESAREAVGINSNERVEVDKLASNPNIRNIMSQFGDAEASVPDKTSPQFGE